MAVFDFAVAARATEIAASASSLGEARARLKSFRDDLLKLRNPKEYSNIGRARPRNFYDRLIAEILGQVRAVASREELVENTISELSKEKDSQTALGYLVLSAYSNAENELYELTVQTTALFNPSRVANFSHRYSSSLSDSKIVKSVMLNSETVDFISTNLLLGVGYDGEFDDLIDDKTRGAWLCALPLPAADPGQPVRMFVALYPVVGDVDQPSLPRGAEQEWRVFGFLRIGYELLNHQLSTLADQLVVARRELIAELAPAIVNHEINQQLTILDENLNLMNLALHGLAPKLPQGNSEFRAVAHALGLTYGAIDRLHAITNAFNNLDKRNPNIDVTARVIIGEAMVLMHPRLAVGGIATSISGHALDETIRTDPTLVQHIVLNVLSNAIDAFMDRNSKTLRPEIVIGVEQRDDNISITIGNNGPPIDLTRPEKIFERGVTTKPHGIGHGLGLYLCRLVTRYLGGSIDLVAEGNLPAETAVAFEIVIPKRFVPIDDILDSAGHSARPRQKYKYGR